MSDVESKPVTVAVPASDQVPANAPPAVPVTENVTSATVETKDDIPAADADVKEGEGQKQSDVNGVSDGNTAERLKDPKEDPVGWIGSLFPAAVHKVNYFILDWVQQLAIEEEEKRQTLPGKNDAVTKNQFLGFLRDGTILARLANRLQPGAAETIHEGDEAKNKTNQVSNINAFISFAKEKVGLSDEQLFTAEDLQDKGKAGYDAVVNTLMRLGMKVQEKFEQKGIDTDQLVQIASMATRTNLIQTILNFFRRARPAQSPKQLAKEAEEKEKAEKVATEKVVEEKAAALEEESKKVDTPAAVAAN